MQATIMLLWDLYPDCMVMAGSLGCIDPRFK